MHVDDLLKKYRLTRDTATAYIDAITRMNQSDTADELGVSRETVNRYKNVFNTMSPDERAHLIASLLHEKLLEHSLEGE